MEVWEQVQWLVGLVGSGKNECGGRGSFANCDIASSAN